MNAAIFFLSSKFSVELVSATLPLRAVQVFKPVLLEHDSRIRLEDVLHLAGDLRSDLVLVILLKLPELLLFHLHERIDVPLRDPLSLQIRYILLELPNC